MTSLYPGNIGRGAWWNTGMAVQINDCKTDAMGIQSPAKGRDRWSIAQENINCWQSCSSPGAGAMESGIGFDWISCRI